MTRPRLTKVHAALALAALGALGPARPVVPTIMTSRTKQVKRRAGARAGDRRDQTPVSEAP